MKQNSTMMRLGFFLGALIFCSKVFAAEAAAERSFFDLPTGNGFGFQILDTRSGRLIAFLDHPYRYLRPVKDIEKDGVERRNLLEGLTTSVAFSGGVAGRGEVAGGTEDTIGGLEELSLEAVGYLEESNIIRLRHSVHSNKRVSNKTIERFFFSPFDLNANAMVALVRARNGDQPAVGATVSSHLRFHLGDNPVSLTFYKPSLEVIKLPGEKIYRLDGFDRPVWVEQGQGLGAMIYLPLQAAAIGTCDLFGLSSLVPVDQAGDRSCVSDDLGFLLAGPVDREGFFGFVAAYVEDVAQVEAEAHRLVKWVNGRGGSSILMGALAEWRNWRKIPDLVFRSSDEARLWRQSETVLRMGQVREPNVFQPGSSRTSHGMILASLAPGHWTTGWVRDGAYATVAWARSGHVDEARRSLEFFLNAQPVGKFKSYLENVKYRISVTRYFGSGEEEADYSGQATPNIETDGWGLVLWAARQYLDNSGDWRWLETPTREGSVYQAMRDDVAQAIVSQLESSGPLAGIMKPDSSIWEVHQQNARHFAYTSLTAYRGLCDFASIAKRSGHIDDYERFSAHAAKIRDAYLRLFKVKEGHLVAAIERSPETDYDAAVAESYGFDVIPDFKSPVAKATLANLEKLRLPGGGFMRSVGDSTYQTNEWAFIDYRMSVAYLRMNQKKKANEIIDRLTERSSRNFFVLPELYVATASEGPLGAYQGSNPMVGYGAGAFMLSVLEREGQFERRNCD